MKYLPKYSSVGCNQTTESLDWGKHNLVLFAASHSIVLYDPTEGHVIRTIVKHTARVNTVKWIDLPDGPPSPDRRTAQFISGSDDHNAMIYTISDVFCANSVVTTQLLAGHSGGVKAIDGKYVNGELLAATASADETVKLWKVSSTSVECLQTIDFSRDLCFAIRICRLVDEPMLAVASGDKVLLYERRWTPSSEGEFTFECSQTLGGHDDWVRGLDFIQHGDEYLLASSAQDAFIRVWKMTSLVGVEKRSFTLESVLSGHDNWVYSVQWSQFNSNGCSSSLQLLSSSMDKTMILWELRDAIWTEHVRVGDIGGHFLGFLGAKMSPTNSAILGHGFHGSFHLWNSVDSSWAPGSIISGHFGEVRDIGWDPSGEYLMSVSADQTTRIHGVYKEKWYEIARPQVHGYDMQVIAILDRYRFASGAEEKIVRTFQAPSDFVRSFRNICAVDAEPAGDQILNSKSRSATLPSLGLSNQVTSEADAKKEEYVTAPPTEETLMQNTLWPETQKLYGHGYEIFALCASSDGKLLASSCKASNGEHAQIILWNTQTWKQQQRLAAHQLTVTQMKFSPNNRQLLSVSRDRKWALFERNSSATTPAEPFDEFKLIASTDKQNGVHGRIIWTCDWSHDSTLFVTGSRDGKCAIWKHGNNNDGSLGEYFCAGVLEIKQSITAISFAKSYLKRATANYLVAVGCESGIISVCSFVENKWEQLRTLDASSAHHLSVRKLEFRPNVDGNECEANDSQDRHVLASCGNDNYVRIHELTF